MFMNGYMLESVDDLKRNFAIDDLIERYYSGELEIFLTKINEHQKASAVENIKNNAFLLIRLYEVFGIEPELTEEEIRNQFS